MRRMLPVDKLAYGASMLKIPSTVERGAMFLKIIAVNKSVVMNKYRICEREELII